MRESSRRSLLPEQDRSGPTTTARSTIFSGETLRKCHAAGLEFHSYFPVALAGGWAGSEYRFDNNGGILADHPEWATINYTDGNYEPSHFGCLSNPEFLDYIDKLVEEQCNSYSIDVLVLDFIRYNARCFCESCKKNYQEMFGEKLQYENVQYCDTYTQKGRAWRAGNRVPVSDCS